MVVLLENTSHWQAEKPSDLTIVRLPALINEQNYRNVANERIIAIFFWIAQNLKTLFQAKEDIA